MAAFNTAVQLEPNNPMMWINLGNGYWQQDRYEETLAMFRRAISIQPDSVEGHWSCARVLLQLGQFAEGWEEFEWRFKYAKMNLNRGFPQPQWDGSDLNGKTILLYTEGGLGDAVNFARLLPFVVKAGGKSSSNASPPSSPSSNN